MKRLFSLLLSSLLVTISVWAVTTQHINSYATRTSVLNGGVVADDRTVDVEFYVMAPTNGVWVYLDMNENRVLDGEDINIYANETLDATAGSGNRYDYETVTCTIPDNVPVGEYMWLVKVRGAQDHSKWTTPQVVRNYENEDYRYSFSRAMGVAVDCSYESEFLGNSYVTETHYQRNAWGNTNSTKTDGVYMFGPAMGKVFNNASGSYGAYSNTGSTIKCNALNTSSYAFGRDDEASNKYWLEYSPARLSTDRDGYVYICENVPAADRTAKVFRMDPANPTKQFEVVLTTSHIEAAAQAIKGNVDGLPKRVQSATVVTDEQGNKLLYTILGTVEDQKIYQSVCLCVFNINDLKNVTYAGKYKSLYQFACNISSTKQTLINVYNHIVPGKNGDVWIFQSRESEDAAYSGTIHLDKNLNCDFIIPPTGEASAGRPVAFNMRGSGAISHDGSILAVPTSGTHITFYNVNYKASDKSSVESLTVKCQMTSRPEVLSSGKKHMVDAMAFDVADNIYFTVNVGTYPNDQTASNKPKGRLYVYALPKADNSHVTPARSSQTIKISDAICWHPYPDSYSMTNEDLQAMFQRDFAAAHSGQDYTTLETNGSELQAYMTSDTSPWKWLGDYLLERGAKRETMALSDEVDSNDNEELWIKFKAAHSNLSPLGTLASIKATSKDRPHNDANNPCGCRIICNNNHLSHAVTTSILSSSEWSWLKDYIKSVQTSLVDNFSDDTNNYWKYAVAAFFLQSQHSSWPTSADFSTAGKPENWGPHSPYWTETEKDLPDNEIDKNSEWQRLLEAFFGCKQITTANGFITPDYSTDGQPSAWYSLWFASLPATPEAVKANGFPMPVRKDHILAGWYYGTKCESGTKAYNITTPVTKDSIAYACVYARWIEACLHEGEVIDPQMLQKQQATYRNFNLDLINLLAGQEVAIKIDRKLVGGMYNTMCLPFAISGKNEFANIQYADGSGKPFASVNDFSLVKYTGTRVTDEAIVLTFQELGNDETLPANTLPANTPFLLKPNSDITKLMQYGTAKTVEVVVHDQGQAVEDDGEGDDGGGAIIPQTPAEYALTVPDESERISYTGVLAPTTIPEGSVLLVANNRLGVSTGGEMKGMRGFFSPLVLPIQQPMAIQITTKDGATTYLDAVNMTTEAKAATKILYNGQIYILRGNEVYDLNGRLLRKQ